MLLESIYCLPKFPNIFELHFELKKNNNWFGERLWEGNQTYLVASNTFFYKGINYQPLKIYSVNSHSIKQLVVVNAIFVHSFDASSRISFGCGRRRIGFGIHFELITPLLYMCELVATVTSCFGYNFHWAQITLSSNCKLQLYKWVVPRFHLNCKTFNQT